MVLKYHLSPYPSLLENMVVKIYEAQSPNAEVHSEVLAAPHNAPRTVIINGLDAVTHIVRLYSAQTNVLLHDYNVEPTNESLASVFDPIRFKIGDNGLHTPLAHTNTFTHPLLNGLGDSDYQVFRNNYGYLFPIKDYATDPGAGSFSLLNDDEFNEEEEFIIQRKPTVSTNVINDSVVGKWFGGFVDIVAPLSYLPVHLRKLLRFKAATAYTFPALAAIPIGYGFAFNNESAVSGTINFSNAPLLYNNGAISVITLKPKSSALFVFDGVNWNVVYITDSSFLEQANTLAGQIIFAGEHIVGDVGGGDPQYTLVHNKAIAGDYMIIYTLRSRNPSQYFRNNSTGATWWHHPTDKPNKIMVSLQEANGELQDIAITYILIKL